MADVEALSCEECLEQIADVIKQYDRMISRLRAAGKLPRNPKEKEQVGHAVAVGAAD